MRGHLVILALSALIAAAPATTLAHHKADHGGGSGKGGQQGQKGDGKGKNGGDTGGQPSIGSSSGGGVVTATEPMSLVVTGVALLGASLLRRRQRA